MTRQVQGGAGKAKARARSRASRACGQRALCQEGKQQDLHDPLKFSVMRRMSLGVRWWLTPQPQLRAYATNHRQKLGDADSILLEPLDYGLQTGNYRKLYVEI